MGECIIDVILRVVVVFRLQDYVLCLCCGFIALGVSKVRPHCRPFSWSDGTIDFPYGGAGTFPSWTLPIISVLPGVAYVVCEALRHLWWEPRRAAAASSRALSSSCEMQRRQRQRQGDENRSAVYPSAAAERTAQVDTKRATNATAHARSPFCRSPPPPSNSIEVLAAEEGVPRPPHFENPAVGKSAMEEAEQPASHAAVAPAQNGSSRAAHSGASSPVMDTAPGVTNRYSTPSRLALPQPSVQRGESSHTSRVGSNTSSGEGTTSSSRPRGPRVAATVGFPLRAPWQRFLTHAHMWVLTQAFAVTFAMLVVDAMKVYAGRLRPDFLSRLRREGYSEVSVDVDWCAAGKGGRVSFPSGHSAISFAAFVPLSFYVLHSLRVFCRSGASLWCMVAGLLPQILPITVAVSRTRDNRHNFDDILAGSLIGIASALIALGANFMANGRSGHLAPRLALRDE